MFSFSFLESAVFVSFWIAGESFFNAFWSRNEFSCRYPLWCRLAHYMYTIFLKEKDSSLSSGISETLRSWMVDGHPYCPREKLFTVNLSLNFSSKFLWCFPKIGREPYLKNTSPVIFSFLKDKYQHAFFETTSKWFQASGWLFPKLSCFFWVKTTCKMRLKSLFIFTRE